MEGNEAYDLSIERAFNTEALSSFFCGVREIDLLIHKKEGGLRSYNGRKVGNTIPMYKYLEPVV